MLSETAAVGQTFSALSDPTRLAIIEHLARGESSLSDLAGPFDMSQTAVSKHVKILSQAGLVKISKRGRTRYCEVLPAPLKQAERWLETYQQFWSEQLNSLSTYLDNEYTSMEENPGKQK